MTEKIELAKGAEAQEEEGAVSGSVAILGEGALRGRVREVRRQKVMLDFESAEVYGCSTKRFNKQAENNIEKFDPDFKFQLTDGEAEYLRSKKSTANTQSHEPVASMRFLGIGHLHADDGAEGRPRHAAERGPHPPAQAGKGRMWRASPHATAIGARRGACALTCCGCVGKAPGRLRERVPGGFLRAARSISVGSGSLCVASASEKAVFRVGERRLICRIGQVSIYRSAPHAGADGQDRNNGGEGSGGEIFGTQ